MTLDEAKARYGLKKPAYRISELPHQILPIGLTSVYAAAKAGDLKITKYGSASFVFGDCIARFLAKLEGVAVE